MSRRRKSDLRRPIDSIERVVGGAAPDDPTATLQRPWNDAVGPAIAAESRPIGTRGETLLVACSDAIWSHELQLMAPQLLARLKASSPEYFGAITEIRTQVGKSSLFAGIFQGYEAVGTAVLW